MVNVRLNEEALGYRTVKTLDFTGEKLQCPKVFHAFKFKSSNHVLVFQLCPSFTDSTQRLFAPLMCTFKVKINNLQEFLLRDLDVPKLFLQGADILRTINTEIAY